MSSNRDLELQELFKNCNKDYVYEFCKLYSIDTNIFEDITGIRFWLYSGKSTTMDDRLHFSPDNNFTYYIIYAKYKQELINNFTKFKKLSAFL